MPDNWSFVAAAYGLAAVVLGGYWRFLRRKERMRFGGGLDGPLRDLPQEKAG